MSQLPGRSSPSGTGFGPAAALQALSHPQYRRFWFATGAGFAAWQMQILIRGWLILIATDSEFATALTWALGMLPMLGFSLVGGIVADRFNRKGVVATAEAANLALYFLTAILVLTDTVRDWHIYTLSFATGLSFALSMPARTAYVSNLVPPRALFNAIALLTALFGLSQVIGPSVAGFLVEHLDIGRALLATTPLSAVALLLYLSTRAEPTASHFVASVGSIRSNLVEGFGFVRGHRMLLALMTMGAIGTIFAFPFMTMIPIIARKELGLNADGAGILMAAAGVGAVAGSMILAAITNPAWRGKTLTGGAVTLGVGVIAFAQSSTFALAIASAMIASLLMQMYMTSNMSLAQTLTPDRLRGRVMSIRMLVFGMGPIGQLATGAIAEVTGAPLALTLMGSVCVLLMVLVVLRIPDLWRLGTTAAEMVHEEPEPAPPRAAPEAALARAGTDPSGAGPVS